jgi:hypothetical protein
MTWGDRRLHVMQGRVCGPGPLKCWRMWIPLELCHIYFYNTDPQSIGGMHMHCCINVDFSASYHLKLEARAQA